MNEYLENSQPTCGPIGPGGPIGPVEPGGPNGPAK